MLGKSFYTRFCLISLKTWFLFQTYIMYITSKSDHPAVLSNAENYGMLYAACVFSSSTKKMKPYGVPSNKKKWNCIIFIQFHYSYSGLSASQCHALRRQAARANFHFFLTGILLSFGSLCFGLLFDSHRSFFAPVTQIHMRRFM